MAQVWKGLSTMARTTETQPQTQKKNRTVIVLLILILLAVCLTAAAGWYFLIYQPDHAKKNVVGGQREAAALQGSIDQMTEEEIQQALDNIVEEGMFRITIASDIIAYENGEADLCIENKLQNRYVMQVTLYTLETDETTGETIQNEIYRTDFIDPGYYIEYDYFDTPLAAGEYDALAIFTALYPDTEEIVGTAGAQVKIHVLAGGATPTPTAEPTATPEPDAAAQLK